QGSIGVDLATAVEVTLRDQNVTLIPTTAKGPLYHEKSSVGGLLLGSSSAGIQDLIIIPGVIDADYTGIIKIMVYTLHPPITIPQGSKIAQIVALSGLWPAGKEVNSEFRGEEGFGSTSPAVLFIQELSKRPQQKLTLSNGLKRINLCLMLDTGADVTIVN
ncbi:POK9 protein, partial [Centropus bengalensis]|nr:POK9 protein [Centropus bengalensis]